MNKNKIIIAVVIYNRFENLKRWIECWKVCDKINAELVIIHNFESQPDRAKYKKYCQDNDIKYVPRVNIGFDIGAFQDVCLNRLAGFDNEWKKILWLTDDTIPMCRNFVSLFTDKINENGIGLACMEISKEVRSHVRTSGFCITKETASKLVFPADPITTKQHCYQFEHRSRQTLLDQINKMGLQAVMISSVETGPLWDTGRPKYINREKEHANLFKMMESKVTFICPIYNSFPEIISSLICQTYKNWELILIHDGPSELNLSEIVNVIGDSRIKYIENEIRAGNWGHSIRQWALNEMKENRLSENSDYVVITNADNHHVPVYIQYMLDGFKNKPNAVASYCEKMVHSYKAWDIINCRMARGYIDCAGVMIKTRVACEVGWRDTTSHSSDWTYFNDIAKKYGIENFVPAKGCLLIHN